MKKFLILLCALSLVVALTMSASAELVTITFDEEGISANCPPQGAGDLITDQYLDLGVEWIVDPITEQPHNEVTRGECFNQQFDIGSDNQVLWYNGNPVEGNIQLDQPADFLRFLYRKPSSTDPVQVQLYNGDDPDPVYDSGAFNAIAEWQTFTYNATDPSGYFDRIQMYSPTNKKFVIDNLEVNTVVRITFDEEGISANCPPQGSGDLITDQYAALGVVWIVDPITEEPHNEVTRGECFNNPFDIGSDNQVLWYNGNPVEGNIQLDLLANSLTFDYRRPGNTQNVQVRLYNGDDPEPVYDVTFAAGPSWETFTYDAASSTGYFDRIQMTGANKFVIDNLEVNMGPIVECDIVRLTTLNVVRGETLLFRATVTNNTDKSGTVLFGTRVTYPQGGQTGYIIGPTSVALNPYQSRSKEFWHTIPMWMPFGLHTYRAYVGNYGAGIYDECLFYFNVVQE